MAECQVLAPSHTTLVNLKVGSHSGLQHACVPLIFATITNWQNHNRFYYIYTLAKASNIDTLYDCHTTLPTPRTQSTPGLKYTGW